MAVVIEPLATSTVLMAPSAIFADVTALSAILSVVTAALAMSAVCTKPDDSTPPALLLITPVVKFVAVMGPSRKIICGPDSNTSPSMVLSVKPVRSPFVRFSPVTLSAPEVP